jgi:hypothetical protein
VELVDTKRVEEVEVVGRRGEVDVVEMVTFLEGERAWMGGPSQVVSFPEASCPSEEVAEARYPFR